MRRSALLLVLLLLAAAFAGCLGGDQDGQDDDGPDADPGPAVSADWPSRALAYGEDHDHHDPAHHRNLSTPNLEVHGWDPLATDYHNGTSGDYFCGEVSNATQNEQRIAATQSFGTDVALVLVDVTDPSQPTKVGELSLPNTHVYDTAITDDAQYAILATSPFDTGPDDGYGPEADAASEKGFQTVQPTFTDACGTTYQGPETMAPYDSGIVLVDIADPTEPEVADYEALPALGAHSVWSGTVDDQRFLLASVTNLAQQNSYFGFYTVEDTPAGGQLLQYGTQTSQQPPESTNQDQPPLLNGHIDGWIREHPTTDQTLAYLANWDGGLTIVELAGPGQILPVGTWNDFDPDAGSGMTGAIHGTLPMSTTWNGTHYTFVGQEVGGRPTDRPTGQVIMLDTTDPTDPTPVARWTLPADVDWGATLQFSTHYFDVVEETRTLFVSTYHGGLWAVDADPSQAPELPSLGVFVPDRVPPTPQPENLSDYGYTWAPIVMDVLHLGDGMVLTFDGQSGAYTVDLHRDVDVPVPDPWTQDAWIGNGTG